MMFQSGVSLATPVYGVKTKSKLDDGCKQKSLQPVRHLKIIPVCVLVKAPFFFVVWKQNKWDPIKVTRMVITKQKDA